MSSNEPLDAITLTMWWNKLLTVVDEAQATLLRTAFSRIVTEAWDFSCALFDARGEMIAQGQHGLPAFLGCMAKALHDFLAVYPADTLRPGDSLITTDPWIGASQINDVFFVTPIFLRGRIVAYAMSVSHSPDVGGRLLSADSKEIFEEGFRLPVMKLYNEGEPNEDLFRIIRLNVRVPDIVVGDLQAQLASNTIMQRRLIEFMQANKLSDLDHLFAAVWERSDRAMQLGIEEIPPGTYHGEVETDGFHSPLTLRCALTVGDGQMSLDCSGSSPQDEHGINCTGRYAAAEAAMACICVARPTSPITGASLKRIHFSAPQGSIINATYPAALGGRALVSMYMQALVFRTLAKAVPDRVIADAGTPPHLSAYMGLGNSGRRFVDIMFLNGGLGARPNSDGVSSLGWPANIAGIQAEVTENEKPLLFLKKELAVDSGGAGRQRGGLSQEMSVRSVATAPITLGVRLDRTEHPALGLEGGKPGAVAQVSINGTAIHPKTSVSFAPGDLFSVRCPGGAGYGDPRERDPHAVQRDVRDGYVSKDVARDVYAIAVNDDMSEVDERETQRLRALVAD
jgi:N-methylhydantoinase B